MKDKYNEFRDNFKEVQPNLQNGNPFVGVGYPNKDIVGMAYDTGILTTPIVDSIILDVKNNINNTHPVYNIYKKLDVSMIRTRLLTKRPLVYYLPNDTFLLRNGTNGQGVSDYLNKISNLDEYIHPDEAVISSLLGMVLPSVTINDGGRNRDGKIERIGSAIVVGQVGARLESIDKGEYNIIHNNPKNIFEQVVLHHLKGIISENKNNNYTIPNEKEKYSIDLYRARSYIILDALVNNVVGKIGDCKKNIVLQVTGLGLGVWPGVYAKQSTKALINALCDVLEADGSKNAVGKIHELQLLWINGIPKEQETKLKKICGEKAIKLQIFQRNPFDEMNSDKIVVSSFAWDGMSYLGNEYYLGEPTSASADPAIAGSTSIAFLGHPEINPLAYKRLWGMGSDGCDYERSISDM
jgi:hypothetical protein